MDGPVRVHPPRPAAVMVARAVRPAAFLRSSHVCARALSERTAAFPAPCAMQEGTPRGVSEHERSCDRDETSSWLVIQRRSALRAVRTCPSAKAVAARLVATLGA